MAATWVPANPRVLRANQAALHSASRARVLGSGASAPHRMVCGLPPSALLSLATHTNSNTCREGENFTHRSNIQIILRLPRGSRGASPQLDVPSTQVLIKERSQSITPPPAPPTYQCQCNSRRPIVAGKTGSRCCPHPQRLGARSPGSPATPRYACAAPRGGDPAHDDGCFAVWQRSRDSARCRKRCGRGCRPARCGSPAYFSVGTHDSPDGACRARRSRRRALGRPLPPSHAGRWDPHLSLCALRKGQCFADRAETCQTQLTQQRPHKKYQERCTANGERGRRQNLRRVEGGASCGKCTASRATSYGM
eukprot:5636570-Prymnesium_polylepis.1